MTFDYQAVVTRATALQGLMWPDAKYDVGLSKADPAGETVYWRCIGVHHLSPEENVGKHSIYLVTIDENGQRVYGTRVGWTWNGRRPDERADPVSLDKPDNEPHGNIPLGAQQVASVWVHGNLSDKVIGLRTTHADEPTADGRLLNSIGHHSFLVIFQLTVSGEQLMPSQPLEPDQPGSLAISEQLRDIICDIENTMRSLSDITETLRSLL